MSRRKATRTRTALTLKSLGQQQLLARVKSQGLTQADIAAAIGKSQQTVCKYMRGTLTPDSFEVVEWFRSRFDILPEAWRLPPVSPRQSKRARAA